jgi:hypothetical protein
MLNERVKEFSDKTKELNSEYYKSFKSTFELTMKEYMSLTPAKDEAEARKIREAIELCGKNRGPHDYMPIEWFYTNKDGIEYKRVSRLLCRVCFCSVNTTTLLASYKDVSLMNAAQNHDTSL